MMPVRASNLREIALKYMREEQERQETYEVPCRVVSPQNPRGDKPFMRIHVSGSLQVRCRQGGQGWYSIIGRQYVKGREAVLGGTPSCDLYTNCGKQKKVGWIDFLGLHSYCPFCHHDRHPVTHQEYDCAIFLLKMREKEEMERRKIAETEQAQGMKQTLDWQVARLAVLGESLSSFWIPQITHIGAQLADIVGTTNAYHNMVSAALEGMNIDVSSRFSEVFEPALGNMINSVTKAIAPVELFKSTIDTMFEPITIAALGNFTRQMADVDLVGKLAGARMAEIASSSVRPVEIFSAGAQVASIGKVIEGATQRSAVLEGMQSLVGAQSGLLATARAISGIPAFTNLGNLSSLAARAYRMAEEYNADQAVEEDEEDADYSEQTDASQSAEEVTAQKESISV
jgi:hypothetical protein